MNLRLHRDKCGKRFDIFGRRKMTGLEKNDADERSSLLEDQLSKISVVRQDRTAGMGRCRKVIHVARPAPALLLHVHHIQTCRAKERYQIGMDVFVGEDRQIDKSHAVAPTLSLIVKSNSCRMPSAA